jgi:hypothetical protein
MLGEMWRDGVRVAEERHALELTVYFTNEVVLMLERTGFVDVAVRAGYADREPTGDDDFVVFIARRRGRARRPRRPRA